MSRTSTGRVPHDPEHRCSAASMARGALPPEGSVPTQRREPGVRSFNVRATAYVRGRLVAEQIKGVDELSPYFVPAVVARRDARAALLMQATHLGDDAAKMLLGKK